MKKITVALIVSLMAVSSVSMARDGNSGGSSIRMEPFSGDVNKATEREKQSIYYKLAVLQDKQKKEQLQKQNDTVQTVQK